ncbi:MAG: energy transducer TonB [Myxococcota bacterium]|nr:energy transducer TonB [Myxococcota bacterium]
MKRALATSVVLHGLLGAALLSVELSEGDGVPSTQAISIEIVSPPTIAPPETKPPPTGVQGGGSFISHASEASTKKTESPPQKARRAQPTPMKVADLVDYSIDRSGSEHTNGGGLDRDGDGGEGNGVGGNRGDGIGFGDGSRVVVAEDFALPPPPAAKPVSKARPAKLIYPSRERDLGEAALFIARVTVDTDGYVVGAKLVRGRSGPRDDEAADLIFRFRYRPALDDAGRAIRTTFEQPFHVNR